MDMKDKSVFKANSMIYKGVMLFRGIFYSVLSARSVKVQRRCRRLIMMNEKEKEAYDDLMKSFKKAQSIEESRHYFVEIQLYLDNLESTREQSITEPQLKEYRRLRRKLVDADSKKEVRYYEEQIHAWLNKIYDSNLT